MKHMIKRSYGMNKYTLRNSKIQLELNDVDWFDNTNFPFSPYFFFCRWCLVWIYFRYFWPAFLWFREESSILVYFFLLNTQIFSGMQWFCHFPLHSDRYLFFVQYLLLVRLSSPSSWQHANYLAFLYPACCLDTLLEFGVFCLCF